MLNPTKTELTTSALNLVVAGTEAAVLMVESEANELPEEVMLGAVVFGHQQQQAAIGMIHELVEAGGKPLWDWQPAGEGRGDDRARSPRSPTPRCARPISCARSRRGSSG